MFCKPLCQPEPKDTAFRNSAGEMTESSTSDNSAYYDEDADEMSLHVGFGNIEVRNYKVTLGDHPNCTYGPPVQLDWNYEEGNKVSLEEYEAMRPPRRRMHQMVLNNAKRTTILNKNGTTPDEIEKAVKDVNKIKRQRGVTKAMLPYMKVEEAAESAGQKLGCLIK